MLLLAGMASAGTSTSYTHGVVFLVSFCQAQHSIIKHSLGLARHRIELRCSTYNKCGQINSTLDVTSWGCTN